MLDKLKFINKNQMIVLGIALILVTVGYVNFASVNTNNTKTEETSANEIEYAGIGDAKLVNSSNVVEIGDAVSTTSENTVDNVLTNDDTNEIVQTSNVTKESSDVDEYFSQSKLNRQTMYSQMLESYQKILENNQISADQKGIAQTEIKNINDTKNKIMICENLIKVKGFDDVIIFVNDQSVSVIVKAKELKQEQISQIQNIIVRELQVDIGNIHISNK